MFDVLSGQTCSSPNADEFREKTHVDFELLNLEPRPSDETLEPTDYLFATDSLPSLYTDMPTIDLDLEIPESVKRKRDKPEPIILRPFESVITVEMVVQVLKDIWGAPEKAV